MNPANQLNNLIEMACRRSDFEHRSILPSSYKDQSTLNQILDSKNYFLTSSVLGMEAMSNVIEDQAIRTGGKFSFYTGCQKLSWLKPQQERYKKLCQLANSVTIFGLLDDVSWNYPNLKVVGLENQPSFETPGSTLLHNWFVVLSNPQFVSIALLAREIPGAKTLKKTIFRNFEGFWTYDQPIINEIVKILNCYNTFVGR